MQCGMYYGIAGASPCLCFENGITDNTKFCESHMHLIHSTMIYALPIIVLCFVLHLIMKLLLNSRCFASSKWSSSKPEA